MSFKQVLSKQKLVDNRWNKKVRWNKFGSEK